MTKPQTQKEIKLALRQLEGLRKLLRAHYGYGWRSRFATEMSDTNGNPLIKSNGKPYKFRGIIEILSKKGWLNLTKETRQEWVKKIENKIKEKSENP